ncbi:ABC transporter ATP-binding protein [Microbacterium excoecariae]|uniref:ABC transporter ATP-binding protein n=1 Tax=Microbacterium excoecariae TaxID=2715210 RepID=UPI00140AF964|nr:ABC transporter ATP-binding protein [Microbacterium excoecariae]NHI17913.1 ABC transporter ATP-binding protein [Microbacterium excoecariae]
MVSAIDVRGLVKRFGRQAALDGLDLRVEPGETRGFLGPNGSGKSTTIRILLGLLRPSGGSARVFGSDPWRDAVPLHRRIAYVPGDVALWPNLTGGEAIDYLSRLRGGVDAARIAELTEAFGLDPRVRCRAYSKGNRQKVALVSALASDAELFVLDEPTSGLDPLMEAVFTREVGALAGRGRAILLSSHILSEVEKVCDTVSIIRRGRVVEEGTLSELRHLTRSRVAATVQTDPGGLLAHADMHEGHAEAVPGGTRVTCAVDDAALPGVLAALTSRGASELTVQPASLEDLFLRHYGGHA